MLQAQPLESTSWKAIELAGKPTATHDTKAEARLQFQAGGRVSGSDGCNQITGTYQLTGDRITFGQMAGTQKACLNPSGTEGPFRDALKSATRWTVAGDRLELFDSSGTRLAMFTASQASGSAPSSGLGGSSWQLVKFQGSDDTTLTPDDPAKYTVEFAAGGQLTARIDCNRGRGTWKSSGRKPAAIGSVGPDTGEVSPWVAARSDCETVGPPSIVRDQGWSSVPLAHGRWRHLRIRAARDEAVARTCARRPGNDFACPAARSCPSSRQVRRPSPPCCSCTDLRAPRECFGRSSPSCRRPPT